MLLTHLATDLPDTVTQPFNQLLGWILWLLCLAGVARLFWIGGQMGHAHHNPHADPPDTPLGVVVGLMVGSSAVGIAAALVTF
ncbi:hypothetical protein G3I15_49940 [Streptomyces sp. SID10244]|nr:hypothetical protein [Streptomyces sp. SID10244]